MEAAHVSLDEAVEIREDNGRIVIEPIRPVQFDLEQLVAGITEENLYNEADFGRAVGQETL